MRSLDSGGSAGGVSMLTDNDAAASHKSICSLCLKGEVEPLVGILDFHIRIGNDGLDSKEECGVAGYYLSIGVCSNIAYMGIGNGAVVHELLELHTGNNAGNVASFINCGEVIEDVLEIGLFGSGLAGCMAE